MKQHEYKINGNLYDVTVNDVEDNIASVEANETSYKVELDTPIRATPKSVTRPATAPRTGSEAPIVTKQPTASKRDGMKSPLPSIILDTKVKAGDTVKRGQTTIILRAMKMENNINTNRDGKVAKIKVNKGDSVLEGTDLIIIE